MAECNACGARVSPGEHFCGNCGTQLIPTSPELKTLAQTLGDDADVHSTNSAAFAVTLDDEAGDETPITAEQPIYEGEPTETGAAAQAPSEDLRTSAADQAEIGDTSLKPISSASLGGVFTDS